ncbi:MAG TPA: DUF4870 domain-containing protein [Pyrinomonadaceae bacterium]|nr:DUF4870 domain-containing protein [Pyrinomonadaceae bacterium]
MQNPPPTEQGYGYGNQYGTPPGGPLSTPPGGQGGKTSMGLDTNVAAALSYIGIIGLIFFFIEKDNRFVRFHAMQSILTGVGAGVLVVVLTIVAAIIGVILATISGALATIISLLLYLLILVIWLGAIGALIFGAIKAYKGEKFKLPVIGDMAEKIAG